MASAIYPKGRESVLDWLIAGALPAADGAFYVIGVDDGYVYDSSHEDLTDVSGLAITAPETALGSLTTTNGWLDAADTWFSGLDDTDEIHAVIVYYKWTGGSKLFAFLDETSDGSLPQPIDSTRGLISWHANGIFRI